MLTTGASLMLIIFSQRSLLLRYIMAMVVVMVGGHMAGWAHAEEHCPLQVHILLLDELTLRAITNRITELLISETVFMFRDSLL